MPTSTPSAAHPPASNVRAAGADDVCYPCSDGKPMADDMWQGNAIRNAAGDLEAALPDALVAAAILVYPERGNNRNRISPDVLVAFGIGTHNRMSYLLWEEGKPPDWVLEVASPLKEEDDRGFKREYYAAMGVPEYWLFDAKGDVYPPGTPRLQGMGLVDGAYPLLASRLADGERMIRSESLGLDVSADGKLLRFRNPATGRLIRHRSEVEADAKRAEAQAEYTEAQAERAEAEAERAEAQAECAKARREAAEARVAELEAALRRSPARHPP